MSLLGTLGGLVGLAVGGPAGAAIGAGIGTLAGGGDAQDALKAGILGYGIGSIPGVQNFAASAGAGLGLGGVGNNAALAQQASAQGGLGARMGQAIGGKALSDTATNAAMNEGANQTAGMIGSGGITGLMNNPYVMAGLLTASEQANPKQVLTEKQERQMDTGERLPGYTGARVGALYVDSTTGKYYNSKQERDAAISGRQGVESGGNFAMGGMVQGPGTGRSDSIPAQIYQNGQPVQEAALSDGEFVMTNSAVQGAGSGDRSKGAAKMYQMMKQFEARA
tara:strand:- start:2020 stop:2859 length:840 start_codon:yes stop_codon:yes gene_type:complete